MKWISALDLTLTNFDVKYFLSDTLRASSIKSYNIFALFFFSLKSSYFLNGYLYRIHCYFMVV